MCLAGATQVDQGTRSVELAVRPPGHAEGTLKRGRHSHRLETSAAHRSAAMAGGARPDPFRTRKLSRRAPMVLRGQPVGEQGAADRWTALDPHPAGSGAGGGGGGAPPPPPPARGGPPRGGRGGPPGGGGLGGGGGGGGPVDPHPAGSGAGAPGGIPPRRPLSLSPRIVQPRAPRGPFFMGGILPCLQIGAEEPCALPAPRLFCFAACF